MVTMKKPAKSSRLRAAIDHLNKFMGARADRGEEVTPPSENLAGWRTQMGVANVRLQQNIRRIRRGVR